jgi:mannan endo-1,4-beta-mannosidase
MNSTTRRTISFITACIMLLCPIVGAGAEEYQQPETISLNYQWVINRIASPDGKAVEVGESLEFALDAERFGTEAIGVTGLAIPENEGWQGIRLNLGASGAVDKGEFNEVSFDLTYKYRPVTPPHGPQWHIELFPGWSMDLDVETIGQFIGYGFIPFATPEEYLESVGKNPEEPDLPASEGVSGFGSPFYVELTSGDTVLDGYLLGAGIDAGAADDEPNGFYGTTGVSLYLPEDADAKDISIDLYASENIAYAADIYVNSIAFGNSELPAEYLHSVSQKVVSPLENLPEIATADKDAAPETKALLSYLHGVKDAGLLLYGQQNYPYTNAEGVYRGSNGAAQGDTYDLVGEDPSVFGTDALSILGMEDAWRGFAELVNPANQRDPANIPTFIHGTALQTIAQWNKGVITTMSMHISDPAMVYDDYIGYNGAPANTNRQNGDAIYTEGNPYPWNFFDYGDSTSTRTAVDPSDGRERSAHQPMLRINNALHGSTDEYDTGVLEVFDATLDIVAAYALELQEAGVPVLLRPFHENSGDFFWWGPSGCERDVTDHVGSYDPAIFIENWQHVVEYLEGKGVHNILYIYSPNGADFDNEQKLADGKGEYRPYRATYPGNDYVDIMAFDDYGDIPTVLSDIAYVSAFANETGKVGAGSEVGGGNILAFLDAFGNLEVNMCYYLQWTAMWPTKSSPTRGSAGQYSANELIDFFNSEKTIFSNGTQLPVK